MQQERPRQIRFQSFRGLSLIAGACALVLIAGCTRNNQWNDIDISGTLPSLAFNMTRANDDKPVSAADYHGKVTLLYFGYTYCPDACPTTLTNIGRVLHAIGPKADAIRVLFVTVDPDRDSLPRLKQYAAAFTPQVDALQGNQNALAALARRYRIAYSVKAEGPGQPYEVTHSSGVYAFDRSGDARLLIPSLSTAKPDLRGVEADLRKLTQASN